MESAFVSSSPNFSEVDNVAVDNDIFEDAFEDEDFFREIQAALLMKRLLDRFSPEKAVAIALLLRGSERILHDDDALFFYSVVKVFGAKAAWGVCLQHGFFQH